jgi:fatty-acyl-CoA synthase
MTMMDFPLNSWMLFNRAGRYFGDTEVVTQPSALERHRYTYAEFSRRTQQLMHALDRLGPEDGERVATLAWNGYRHLECYFAIPCSRRVSHTLNPRLPEADLRYIIDDAEDRIIFVEENLLPLLERLWPTLATKPKVVVLGDHVGESSIPHPIAYEDLIADEPSTYPQQEIPERAPLGMCYTSGTEGRPKGVVYTHRSTYLHAITLASGSALGLGPADCVMPVVPMFHVNAWGIPYAATLVGAKQVLNGPNFDAKTLVDLLAQESVTVSSGVPTVWTTVGDELARRQIRLPALRHLTVGGSQPPRALIERYEREFNITIVQGWGMTETSPVASMAIPKNTMRGWSQDRLMEEVRTKAGLPLPGVEVRIVDGSGQDLPEDGKSMGELLVRAPWVTADYWKGVGPDHFTTDGWLRTGDVAVASAEGYFVIVDRTKDLIKSGGEWISSVDMEGDLMGMSEVAEASVVAIPDPKWEERPLAVICARPGAEVTLGRVREHLTATGWARWQLPDRIELVDAIPKTSVGKFDKKVMRARFGGSAAGHSQE